MNRRVSCQGILGLVLTFCLVLPARAGLRGDLNRDGLINGADIRRFAQLLRAPGDATVEEACAADTNEDSALNELDIVSMTELLLGMTPSLWLTQGHWDCPFAWGPPGQEMTAIHAGLVPGRDDEGRIIGRVLTFGHYGDPNHYLWNPDTGEFSLVSLAPGPYQRSTCAGQPPEAMGSLFCSGHSHLGDGKVLVTGGDVMADDLDCPDEYAFAGAKFAHLFDPFDTTGNPWTQIKDMHGGRWYPTNTTLADGRVLVTSGYTECSFCNANGEPVSDYNRDVEIYTPPGSNNGGFEIVSSNLLPLYPRMHLLSNGNVFYSGPSPYSQVFNTTPPYSWSNVAVANYQYRTYGTSVLVPNEQDRIMIIAGELYGVPPTKTTETIRATSVSPQWQYGPSLSFGRCHANAVLLPDGKILVVGGRSDSCFGPGPAQPVYRAELLDPGAPIPAWQLMASMARQRMYHSTALLLPDGRVLSAGGTEMPGFPGDDTTAQVFYPPYLFVNSSARPAIKSLPELAAYGQSIVLTLASAASIQKVVAMRPSMVTHSFDMEQRYVNLDFSPGPGAAKLTLTIPDNANIAPPGYYMIFVITHDGVPSEAKLIRFAS